MTMNDGPAAEPKVKRYANVTATIDYLIELPAETSDDPTKLSIADEQYVFIGAVNDVKRVVSNGYWFTVSNPRVVHVSVEKA